MRNKGKVFALTLSAAALVAASVFGTMAYLTDNESVTNTFTVGKVGLTLDEADVKPDGTLDTNARVQENEYHLLPGYTYTKDPTIHVSDDSEECYLFVIVENGIAAIETTDTSKTIAGQMTTLGWVPVAGGQDASGNAINNLYVLTDGEEALRVVKENENVVVFNNFTIDGDKVVYELDNNDVPDGKVNLAGYATAGNEDAKVVVTAYAVQKAGFEDKEAAAIWNATFGK